MPPQYSSKDIIKVAEKLGYVFACQKWSHMRYERETDSWYEQITIPAHKALAHGTFWAILRQMKIDREVFFTILAKK